jgi:N-acetylmuramoyl-L-alanine amidase
MSEKITHIIMHCSDSEFGCAALIRQWHLENGWKDIGYHFVIGNGRPTATLSIAWLIGEVEIGRLIDGNNVLDENEVGAHALGYNRNSLGVCLIGKKDFLPYQMGKAVEIVMALCKKFEIPTQNVLGHYETTSGKAEGKTCPNFEMEDFRKRLTDRMMFDKKVDSVKKTSITKEVNL